MSALPPSKCARSFDPAPAFATLPPLPAALVRRGDLRLLHRPRRQPAGAHLPKRFYVGHQTILRYLRRVKSTNWSLRSKMKSGLTTQQIDHSNGRRSARSVRAPANAMHPVDMTGPSRRVVNSTFLPAGPIYPPSYCVGACACPVRTGPDCRSPSLFPRS